jgi:hypothetical protein
VNANARRAVYKRGGASRPLCVCEMLTRDAKKPCREEGAVEPIRERIEGFLRGRYGYGGRRAFGVPAVNPLGRRLRKPTVVVLAVAVVAMVLYFVLLYFGLFLPRLPPLIARPEEPLPAEDSIIVPTPPSKILLEPKPDPEGDRRSRGEGAWSPTARA